MGRSVTFKAARGVAAVLACATVVTALPSRAADPAKVTIGIASRSFNPGFSNMWIGIPLGLYGADLLPEAVGTQGAAENLQLMLAGQVTMSTGTQDVFFNASAEGRQLPVVTPCVYLRGLIHRVTVPLDSKIKTYADLKDKRVGLPTLAYGGVGYLKFAAKHAGIDPDSIQMVAVGDGQQAAAALLSGRIDALTNADVDVARLQSLGIKLRVVAPPDAMRDAGSAYVFAFTRPWYDGHKKEAALLLKGMIRAIIVMLENPEAAVRVSFYMHPEAVPSGISFDQGVAAAVDAIKVRAPAIERVVPGSSKWCEYSPAAWAQFTDLLGVKGKVDPARFYTDELIGQINDFDEPKLRAWARGLKVPATNAETAEWLKTLHPPL